MPLYVALGNWTDQGVKNVKDTAKRADAFAAAAKSMNCTVREILYTMGPYDLLTIIEAPNDETVSKLALAVGMLGNIRTVSMRAHTKDEMARIVAGLP